MTLSQRRFVRLPVRTLVCNLDHWNEATILNVSEGGMALQAMAPVNMSRPVRVILDWAESSGSIEASGKVAWNDHGRAGVRFSSIGETSRDRLIEWLFQDVAARCVKRENLISLAGRQRLRLDQGLRVLRQQRRGELGYSGGLRNIQLRQPEHELSGIGRGGAVGAADRVPANHRAIHPLGSALRAER